jgi:hypothetical protein
VQQAQVCIWVSALCQVQGLTCLPIYYVLFEESLVGSSNKCSALQYCWWWDTELMVLYCCRCANCVDSWSPCPGATVVQGLRSATTQVPVITRTGV